MQLRFSLTQTALLLGALILPSIAYGKIPDESVALAERHYKLGQKLYRAGHTDDAIEELYTAVATREIFYDAQLLLGRSLLEARRYREAAAVLKEIEAPRRGVIEVHKLLGKSYYEMNKLIEADMRFIYAIALSGGRNHELHYLLGLVKLRRGMPDRAILEAKKALTLKSRYAPAQKLLSDAYTLKEDFAQAKSALTRYLSMVRGGEEAAEIKEKIQALDSLSRANPETSVQKQIKRPEVHRIPKPGLTFEALRYGIEGAVHLQILFGSDGTIQHVLLVRGLGFGLDQRATAAAKAIEFKPGEVDGKPVPMWMRVVIIFGTVNIEVEKKEGYQIALATVHSNRRGSDYHQISPELEHP